MHSGVFCAVRVSPAPSGTGRVFYRVPEGSLREWMEANVSDEEAQEVDNMLEEEVELTDAEGR